MIRYRLWVWVLCLMFPTWVWAENEIRTCTSFTQQGRQVTFSPDGQCRLAIATLQLFRRENLVLTRRAIATKKCFVCSD